jgi:hypothetical protein
LSYFCLLHLSATSTGNRGTYALAFHRQEANVLRLKIRTTVYFLQNKGLLPLLPLKGYEQRLRGIAQARVGQRPSKSAKVKIKSNAKVKTNQMQK